MDSSGTNSFLEWKFMPPANRLGVGSPMYDSLDPSVPPRTMAFFDRTSPLMALVAGRAIERLQEWAPRLRIGVLLAGYAGESAVTFGALFAAREP